MIQTDTTDESLNIPAFFEQFASVPYVRDVQHWLTSDLGRTLDDIEAYEIDCPPVPAGVSDSGFRLFAPGYLMSFFFRFHDGTTKAKTINLNEYRIAEKVRVS